MELNHSRSGSGSVLDCSEDFDSEYELGHVAFAQPSLQESTAESNASDVSKREHFDFITLDHEMPAQLPGEGNEDVSQSEPHSAIPPPLSTFPSRPSTGLKRAGSSPSHKYRQIPPRSQSAGAHQKTQTWKRIHSTTAQENETAKLRQRKPRSPSKGRQEEAVAVDRFSHQTTRKQPTVGVVRGQSLESLPSGEWAGRPSTSQGLSRFGLTSEWSLNSKFSAHQDDSGRVGLGGIGWSKKIQGISRPQTAMATLKRSPRNSHSTRRSTVRPFQEPCVGLSSALRDVTTARLVTSPSASQIRGASSSSVFVGSPPPSRPATAALVHKTPRVRSGRWTASPGSVGSGTLHWVDHVGLVDKEHGKEDRPWPPKPRARTMKDVSIARQHDLARARAMVAVDFGARTTYTIVHREPESSLSSVPQEGFKHVHDKLPARPVGGRWTLMSALSIPQETESRQDHHSRPGSRFLPRPEVPHSRFHHELHKIAAERGNSAGKLGGLEPKADILAAVSYTSVAYLKALMHHELSPPPPPPSPPGHDHNSNLNPDDSTQAGPGSPALHEQGQSQADVLRLSSGPASPVESSSAVTVLSGQREFARTPPAYERSRSAPTLSMPWTQTKRDGLEDGSAELEIARAGRAGNDLDGWTLQLIAVHSQRHDYEHRPHSPTVTVAAAATQAASLSGQSQEGSERDASETSDAAVATALPPSQDVSLSQGLHLFSALTSDSETGLARELGPGLRLGPPSRGIRRSKTSSSIRSGKLAPW